MAENINVVSITGNLTSDPELRHTGGGTSVCGLRVAVNGRRKDQSGQWVDKPNFFNVTVWGRSGETAAQYLAKGRPVAIQGRLDWREWEAQDGSKRQTVEIVAERVQFLGGNDGGGNGGGQQQAAPAGNAPPPAAPPPPPAPAAPAAPPPPAASPDFPPAAADDDIPF